MNVLVIGGTGIIGSGIVEAAISQGNQVSAICRNQKPIHDDTLSVNYLFGDWNDNEFAKTILINKSYDVIVDGLVFNKKSLIRDLDIVRTHCQHFIYISTAGVYEQPLIMGNEFASSRLEKLIWSYSRNKKKAEIYIEEHKKEYPFLITIVRPPFVYGDTRIPCAVVSRKNQWSLVQRIVDNKPIVFVDDNDSKHAVTHISTFSKSVVGLFMKKETDGEIFHVSDDYTYSWDDVILTVGKILNKQVEIIHVPVEKIKLLNYELYLEIKNNKFESLTLNNEKIKEICPNVNYQVELSEGLCNTLDYLKRICAHKGIDTEFDEMEDMLLLDSMSTIASDYEKQIVNNYVSQLDLSYIKRIRKRRAVIICREIRVRIVMLTKTFVKKMIGEY